MGSLACNPLYQVPSPSMVTLSPGLMRKDGMLTCHVRAKTRRASDHRGRFRESTSASTGLARAWMGISNL